MKYKTLKSIFYSDSTGYSSEYLCRFNSPSAVKFNIDINGSPAFMLVTQEILNQQFDILKLNEQLNKLTDKLPSIVLEQYIKKCLIDEVVLTNEIEGVLSTRKDVFEVLSMPKNTAKHKRLIGLVSKYQKLSEEKIPISSNQDIRNLYDALVLEEIKNDDFSNIPDGTYFRKDGVNVVSKFGKKIHSGIAPEENINSAMTAALDILNDNSLNILIRIAVFHYFFGYIHPFYDGNGRTDRFITSYILANNFNILTGYRLAYVIKGNLAMYYNSFKTVNDTKNKGDITPFVIDFFDILIKLFHKLINSVTERYEQLSYYKCICQKLFAKNNNHSDIAFIIVQQALFGVDGISTEELILASHCSKYAVRQCIAVLRDKQLIKITKLGTKPLYNIDLDKLSNISF